MQLRLSQQALVVEAARQLQEPPAGVELLGLHPGMVKESDQGCIDQRKAMRGTERFELGRQRLETAYSLFRRAAQLTDEADLRLDAPLRLQVASLSVRGRHSLQRFTRFLVPP